MTCSSRLIAEVAVDQSLWIGCFVLVAVSWSLWVGCCVGRLHCVGRCRLVAVSISHCRFVAVGWPPWVGWCRLVALGQSLCLRKNFPWRAAGMSSRWELDPLPRATYFKKTVGKEAKFLDQDSGNVYTWPPSNYLLQPYNGAGTKQS